MSFRLDNSNLVVLAEQHNPTILHPAFLFGQRIVPPAFEVDDQQTVCSPAVSHVRFTNSVDLVAQADRLQVAVQMDQARASGIEPEVIRDIAADYINVLRHVTYTAVGFNFFAVIPHKSPREYMRDRVLADGPWKHMKRDLQSSEVHMFYDLPGGTLRVGLSAVHHAQDETDLGIGVDANYHFPLQVQTSESALEKVKEYNEHLKDYFEIAALVAEEERAT